jgi:hypothetical protein
MAAPVAGTNPGRAVGPAASVSKDPLDSSRVRGGQPGTRSDRFGGRPGVPDRPARSRRLRSEARTGDIAIVESLLPAAKPCRSLGLRQLPVGHSFASRGRVTAELGLTRVEMLRTHRGPDPRSRSRPPRPRPAPPGHTSGTTRPSVSAGSQGMVSTLVVCRYASAWAIACPQLPSVSYESSHPMTPPNLGNSWRRGWITSVTSWDAVK